MSVLPEPKVWRTAHSCSGMTASAALQQCGKFRQVASAGNTTTLIVLFGYTASVEEILSQILTICAEDTDLLTGLQAHPDPRHLHDTGKVHRDVHRIGHCLLKMAKVTACGADRAATLLLKQFSAKQS